MRRPAFTIACAAALVLAVTPAALAARPQGALAALGAQRAANGLPAAITENATWSKDCAAHDHYMALNHLLTHTEDPTKPGYSKGGAFAGQNGVLIEGAGWDSGDPYEFAPLHLDQLLAPRLQVIGSADAEGYSCTITFPGLSRTPPAAPTVYTYPGSGASIYASEVAREQPWTPGDLVGIRQPARTGPYLIVLVDAPGASPTNNPATLRDATLTGPSGAVPVTTVDGATSVPTGASSILYPYIPPSGFIIPVAPLRAGTTYHAHVVVTFAGTQTAHNWSFTTRGADPQSALTASGPQLSFTSSSPVPIRVTLTRANGAHVPSIRIAPGHHARLHLGPGSWQACGHQRATIAYASYDHCVPILVTGVPSLRFGAPQVVGSEVQFAVYYSRVLQGRSAMLEITPLTVRCMMGTCTTTAGTAVSQTIVIRSRTLSFPLPAVGQGLRLAIATSAFQLADAPWTAARAVSQAFVRR
jgi:hypothetical protein